MSVPSLRVVMRPPEAFARQLVPEEGAVEVDLQTCEVSVQASASDELARVLDCYASGADRRGGAHRRVEGAQGDPTRSTSGGLSRWTLTIGAGVPRRARLRSVTGSCRSRAPATTPKAWRTIAFVTEPPDGP
jgi:hypothetical protein